MNQSSPTTATPTDAEAPAIRPGRYTLSHLAQLEAESIHIIREVVAECENPVMLYSVGKDSGVLLHLARKAFAPAKIPFPLMHVDTTFKFPEMYEFRDRLAAEIGAELIVHRNEKALDEIGRDPECWTCSVCADQLKTQALIQALTQHQFDAAICGARRDEERSRAKERIFSFRNNRMQWDPRNQRPELWNVYNTRLHKGESLRVFPLSNWTELDIWHYIYAESIPVVSLYLARPRPVVYRDGMMLMVSNIIQPREGERVEEVMCRYRTLGCQLCTGAAPSEADTLEKVILETIQATKSERQNRAVDQDRDGSMEDKKREGYF